MWDLMLAATPANTMMSSLMLLLKQTVDTTMIPPLAASSPQDLLDRVEDEGAIWCRSTSWKLP